MICVNTYIHIFIYLKDLKSLEDEYNQIYKHKPGGVCDMILIGKFIAENKRQYKTYDLLQPMGYLYFDNVISESQGFVTSLGIKKIKMKERGPYVTRRNNGDLVPMATLHFQGNTKKQIIRFANLEAVGLFLRFCYRSQFIIWALNSMNKAALKRGYKQLIGFLK